MLIGRPIQEGGSEAARDMGVMAEPCPWQWEKLPRVRAGREQSVAARDMGLFLLPYLKSH